jgi:hypothetical protein
LSYKDNKIIEARIQGKIFLLQRPVYCGKGCSKCPHGPYWYGFYRHKGKTISFYVGKTLPPRFKEAKRVKITKHNTNGQSHISLKKEEPPCPTSNTESPTTRVESPSVVT